MQTYRWTLTLICLLMAFVAQAVRVKDVASLRGARDNQLTGFGIIVGLNGTGDSQESLLARKPVINALERIGISLNQQDIIGRSIAAVWLTATLPPFAKSGQRIDVTVSTIGDSSSLRGGVLVMAPLRGPNRLVYAVAQGPVIDIPRLSETQPDPIDKLPVNSSMVRSVGKIPNGALVEQEINLNLNSRTRIYMNLKSPDFTTAFRLEKLINYQLGEKSARAKDAGSIEVIVPHSYLGRTVELVSYIENLDITPDQQAKVVLDERSGTIVMGKYVRISPVAISQGSLSIEIKPQDAQPAADGQPEQHSAELFMLKGGVDLKEIVDGFNKIGASSQDLSQILKAVKASGALHADLVIR